MAKRKVLISACLAGYKCRYDGNSKPVKEIIDFICDNEVVLVCPEQLANLPIPRDPSEIVGDKVINSKGKDVTKEFKNGAKKALEIAIDNNVELAILKSKSPSCGKGKIYDGTFTRTLKEGNGLFADLCIKHGIKVISEKEFVD